MNVTRLRAIMHRYKEAGVLLVGAYLVGHHLWTKRRITLLATPATLLILACWFAVALRGPNPAPKLPVAPSTPRVVRPTTPTSQDYRPKQPLLPHAKQVAALDEYYLTHSWITSDRLLLVTSAKPTRIYDCLDVFPGEWKGRADLLNLHTGRRHKLEGLTRLFQRMQAMPYAFETSPGGEWLSWTNVETGDGWPNTAIARWDGSGFQEWMGCRGSDNYWLDDHRWVEDATHCAMTADDPILVIYNANRKKTSILKAKSKGAQKLIHAHEAVCEHEFTTGWREDTARVTISEDKRTHEDGYVPPLHFYSIPMPAGADVEKVLVSSETHRVLYVLRFHQVAVGIQPQSKYDVLDLWSSRLDGNDLKELGYVEKGEQDCSDDTDPMTAQNMIKLEWLPDGKQFSFIYRKHLYRAAGY